MKKSDRPTVGFVIPNLMGEYFGLQWFSTHHSAIEHDVNLVIICPFMFLTGEKNFIEYVELYRYLGKTSIDGLIVSSLTLPNYYTPREVEQLYQIFSGETSLPLVTLGPGNGNSNEVVINNKEGMKQLVSHFVVDHGYKEIAFIKGPPGNAESIQRYEAYCEVLEEKGIPLKEALVVQGDFGYHAGRQGVTELLDRRRVNPRAIIAANDDMILGVYTELMSRGIEIPGKIALGGFDNIKAIQETEVPITTVRQPFDEQVNLAMTLLLDKLAGKTVSSRVTLAAKLLIRASCGCDRKSSIDELPGPGEDKYFKYLKFLEDYEKYKSTQEGFDMGFISEFSNSVMNAMDLQVVREECEALFKKAGVKNGLVNLYHREAFPIFRVEQRLPVEEAHVMSFFKKEESLPIYRYKTEDLFHKDFFTSRERKTIFFTELLFRQEHYGYLVLETREVVPLFLNLFILQLSNCFHNLFNYNAIERANRALEKARQEAENANQLKSRFLANVSHEIRTPMNAILGFINILKSRENNREKLEYMDIISESGAGLLKMLNDILDLSKIESEHIELIHRPFNFLVLMEQVRKMFLLQAEEKDIHLNMLLLPGIPELLIGDETRIRQIVMNLISNAIRYTPTRGRVEILSSYTEGLLTLSVEDSGVGIPEESLKNIFEPFIQYLTPQHYNNKKASGYGGTGLGLSISRKLALLMHGSLTAFSVPGEGSRFSFSAPLPPGGSQSITFGHQEDRTITKHISPEILLSPEERRTLTAISRELEDLGELFHKQKAKKVTEQLIPYLHLKVIKEYYIKLRNAISSYNSLELARIGREMGEAVGYE